MDLIAKANSRYSEDRYGLPRTKPGCGADIGHLGWVPGVQYRIWSRDIDLCLGYRADGSVDVLRNGQVVNHRTSIHRSDRVVEPCSCVFASPFCQDRAGHRARVEADL